MIRSLKSVIAAIPVAGVVLGASVLVLPVDAIAGRQVNNTTRTSVNKNTNVNRNTNVNVNSSRHVDVDVDVDRGYHPVGTALAVGATVAVTSAVVGSIVSSVPPSCVPVQVGAVLYQQCGTAWYQPQYAGTTVQYVVVNPPR
jgi:hypothetical protein